MGDGHLRRYSRDAWRFAAYFGPPIIMYLLARKVTKEMFISYAAMLYLIGIVLVFSTLAYKGVLSEKELVL